MSAAPAIYSWACMRSIGMGDRWPAVSDVAEGRRGRGILLNPGRGVKAPSDRAELDVRLEAARVEAQAVAAALARLPAGPSEARSILEAAAAELERRFGWFEGFEARLATLADAYHAALDALIVAERAATQAEPEAAVEAAQAVTVAEARERQALRAGELLVTDEWRSTSPPACPALAAARARRNRLAAALDAVLPAAREHAVDPLAGAVEPIEIDAKARRGLGLDVEPTATARGHK